MAMDQAEFKRREQLQRIPAMPCGLYRTTLAIPGHEQCVGADLLVMLHDHRPEELPSVCLPSESAHNRWIFSDEDHAADDAPFLEHLEPLPDEGLYVLLDQIPLSEDPDHLLPAGSLVMVGYDRRGNCILYPARFEGLQIAFPERGYRFETAEVFASLEVVNFDIPLPSEDRSIH
jgi:hypothetical protein